MDRLSFSKQYSASGFLKMLYAILFVLITLSASAQPGGGFGDDVDDETPPAPINNAVGIVMVSGVLLAYYFISRKDKTPIYKNNKID